MKPTPTGIAVALALAVVASFYLVPGLSPWRSSAPAASTEAQFTTDAQPASTTATTPIPAQPITELMMKDDVIGTGATAAVGDSVTVNYVGALTNGTVFDASANHGSDGFTFTLGAGQVIKGWDEGLVGMKVGGKRTLIIPAALAYGSQAVGDVIPANSDLVFQVELVKVQKKAQ